MTKIKRILLPAAIPLAGIILMGFGIWRGELHEIFHRGIVICYDCIGIG